MRLERAPERKFAKTLRLWAPPRFWSQWYTVLELNSGFRVSIETRSISPIKAFYEAEVAYIDANGNSRVVNFSNRGSIRVNVGSVVNQFTQAIKVRFRSSLNGQIILTIVRYG